MVELSGEGIVDDSDLGYQVVDEGKRYTDVGIGVDEVGGTIYWIADEGWRRSKVKTRMIGFFTKESVGGKLCEWIRYPT